MAMRQRILGSHTPPCHRRMVITTLCSMFCLAALQRRRVRCRLSVCMRHSGWLLNVLWLSGRLGQLAPTTLPQRRLASNRSLCGPLSLCVSSSSPSQGGLSYSAPSQGGFSSSSPSPQLSLCPSLPCVSTSSNPPPSACRYNSGVPPFTRRRAQQRVKESHSVPCDRVCLPEECFLKQPYQISSTRQPHVQAVSIPTY